MTFERLFPTGCVLAALFFAGLLFQSLNRAGEDATTKAIGKVYFKNRIAQRKLSGRVAWADLGQAATVYNRDTLRTEEQSLASVELFDGTRIEMDQNSMIILAVSTKAAQIQFAGGSVRAVGGKQAGARAVQIQAGNQLLTTSGDVQLSRTKAAMVVNVRAGLANLRVGDQERQIKENEQSVVRGDQVEVQQISLIPIAPADNSQTYTDRRARVEFSWSGAKSRTLLEVSTGRDFSQIVGRRTARERASLALAPGLYYWRVRAADGSATSAVRRLSVLERQPLRLYSPLRGQRLSSRRDQQLVSFSWSSNEHASAYELELADNVGFSNSRRFVARTNGLARELAAGNYYWRVRTRAANPQAIVTSPVFRFRLTRERPEIRHVLLAPGANAAFTTRAIAARGLFFNWMPEEGVRYTLEVSRSRDFATVLHSRSGNGGFARWSANLSGGGYYWRVRAVADGASSTSPVRRFRVEDTLGTPQFVSPSEGEAIDMSDRSALLLRWQPVSGAEQYSVELVRVRDGRRVLRRRTREAQLSIGDLTLLSTGRFRATVAARARGKQSEEARCNFSLTIRSLPPPTIQQ